MTIKQAKQLKAGDRVSTKGWYDVECYSYTVTHTRSQMDAANLHEHIIVYGVTKTGAEVFHSHKALV